MDFSEKLNALMTLSAMTNTALSKVMNVDRSSISRIRTGARGMPKPQVVHRIAENLALRCEDEYQISALYELTSDSRLQFAITEQILTDILFDWLLADDPEQRKLPEKFRTQTISLKRQEPNLPIEMDSGRMRQLQGSLWRTYYGRMGKKKALRDFFSFILTLEKASTVQFFSDEDRGWLADNVAFSREISGSMRQIVSNGHQFFRVQTSEENLKNVYLAMERWLPFYRTNSVKEYYYLWPRDDLHRRTLYVVPGKIAMFSSSVCGQTDSRMTILTTEPEAVGACTADFSDLLAKCRRAMQIYTIEKPTALFQFMVEFASIAEPGISRSRFLSPMTLPETVLNRIARTNPPIGQKLAETYRECIRIRTRMLSDFSMTDLMSLPPMEDVLGGCAAIPGTSMLPGGSLFYTVEEYSAHLEQILRCLTNDRNYHALFT